MCVHVRARTCVYTIQAHVIRVLRTSSVIDKDIRVADILRLMYQQVQVRAESLQYVYASVLTDNQFLTQRPRRRQESRCQAVTVAFHLFFHA